MEDKSEILRTILPTGMLAPTISSLASALGYKGRATLYRILDGTASYNAIDGLYKKLETIFFLDEDSLYNISTAIDNTGRLNRLLKAETDDFRTCNSFDVLKAFISHNYSLFSENFRRSELPGLLRLEQIDPDAFFQMLAYFYFKSLRVDFYEGEKTYRERCARIMEPLGRQLMELYPANGIAAMTVFVYSQSSILDAEAPILWSFITTLATMLRMYGTPDIGSILAKDMYLVSFLSDRTYWMADNHSDLILMRAVRHNVPGSGYYDVFKIYAESGKAESLGVMTFLSDEVFSYRNKLSGTSQLGTFSIDDGSLGFMWGSDKESPFESGNHWKRQSLQHSHSLRMIDKRLSDTMLNEAAQLADGHKLLTDQSVTNVNMSRTGVRLSLSSGVMYEISYAAAPFLEYILPTNEVIVAERISDGEIFVSWPQLMHCIPLRLFTRIDAV